MTAELDVPKADPRDIARPNRRRDPRPANTKSSPMTTTRAVKSGLSQDLSTLYGEQLRKLAQNAPEAVVS